MAEQASVFSPEDVLGAVARGMDEALVVYDRDFVVLFFNTRAEALFGISAADIVGTRFSLEKAKEDTYAALAPVIYSSLAPTMVRMSEPGSDSSVIKIILDDPHREYIISTSELSHGALFVKIVRDATREASLVQSKTDFLTVAAHQLRTPATAVGWTFDTLLHDPSLSSSAREAALTGQRAAQNLLATITNVLQAAQQEEGRFGYTLQSVDLVSFLNKLLLDAMPVAEQYGVQIYFERPSEPAVMVSADAAKLGLAVGNLIDNAIKYNIRGGQVVVTLSLPNAMAHISVKDTGMGIPEADIPKLFEKFFRAENARQGSAGGSGLGLYLAKNIIEGHHGKLWVESVLGRGSTFHCTLPLFTS